MSLARVFCSWSIAAVLLLLSIAFSSSETSVDQAASSVDGGENGEEGNGTASNVTLTGNPQIDYVHDPNLPRELNGYNLSDYPFYHRVPKNINFSCDGRKDGFYASVEHKCQIYHHCLFSNRFDFICANYTAFDQRTFICQFVSDVDCPNSHMYFHRNKDLYVTKSTTTEAPVYRDRSFYERERPQRPQKKPKLRPRPAAAEDEVAQPQEQQKSTSSPAAAEENRAPAPPPKKGNKDVEYDDDYYEEDYRDYQPRRPRPRRRFRKCRNGRRRGRRCRPRRPLPYYYDEEDYAYDDDYDYAYYDDARPKKAGRKKKPLNAISAGTSQITSTTSSETPPEPSSSTSLSTTVKSTTEPPPFSSTSSETSASAPLDSDSIAMLQKQRDELLTKTRRPLPNFRVPALRPSRQDKTRPGTTSSTTSTTTTTTTTERAKPTLTTSTTTTTTEAPQYIYDYEYYEDDTPGDSSSPSPTTTTTTTVKPFFRGKLRGGNSATSLIEKQRVQQSIQVRVTEDSGTNTNTIRRRDNSNVQTPTRSNNLPTPPPPMSSTSTHNTAIPSTTGPSAPVSRPARFWQRKSTVKSISTTSTPTTTTTQAPYYQDYQDYEDMIVDQQPSPPAPSLPPPQSSKFHPLLNSQHHQQQYGTSPASSALRQTYGSTTGPSVPQQHYATSPRGHLSSSSYAPSSRPNKHYAMQHQPQQQYSQSSSSSSSSSISSNNNNNNYNTNSYHRQRLNPSPPSVIPKPEFISLVDEDYSNPYGGGGIGPTSPSSTPSRYNGGGGGGSNSGGGPGVGYHQHPIRFFEQHQPPAFLFGSASEYNAPQFAFPPNRNTFPSPSNFQPYGHNTRRYSPHQIF